MLKAFSSLRRRLVEKVSPFSYLHKEGPEGIEKVGHRNYVGGMWDEIGTLQFEFLTNAGLKADDCFLDIACGSLRLGVKVIPYLDQGHYFGLEKESLLVEMGIKHELDDEVRALKKPTFILSDSFEFNRCGRQINYAMAHSLFTHLTAEAISSCFRNLVPCLAKNGRFYATFYETPTKHRNPATSHSLAQFAYTKSEIVSFGEAEGLSINYIGQWGHPRGQIIVEFIKSGDA